MQKQVFVCRLEHFAYYIYAVYWAYVCSYVFTPCIATVCKNSNESHTHSKWERPRWGDETTDKKGIFKVRDSVQKQQRQQ